MRADEIRDRLKSLPFKPFRMHISDGSHYDIRHPDFLFVTKSLLTIGLESDDAELPERSTFVDPIHVTRLEPITEKRSRTNGRRKK